MTIFSPSVRPRRQVLSAHAAPEHHRYQRSQTPAATIECSYGCAESAPKMSTAVRDVCAFAGPSRLTAAFRRNASATAPEFG